MDSTETTEDGDGIPRAAFRFVADLTDRSARSHAMREHWKHRRQRLGTKKKKAEAAQREPPLIQPSVAESSCLDGGQSTTQSSGSSDSSPGERLRSASLPQPDVPLPGLNADSIRSQALRGLNLALGINNLDPFDQFPVKLTPEHHKLLHHWLVTYAAMVFDSMSPKSFNPMREVWMPLDLSNAASFNAIMAHSAAHLARMQGKYHSEKALEFKAEAMRIVNSWMADPALCMSDEVVAAILRLLTYERNWGVESEWYVHHEGLLKLVELRGGIEAVQSNWRVGLPLYLVSLMSSPSWFNPSNMIWKISDHLEAAPIVNDSDTLHKVRSLWFLSLVQDIQTFVYNNLNIYRHILATCRAVISALTLLQTEATSSANSAHTSPSADQAGVQEPELKRLACMFFLCIASTDNAFWMSLDTVLQESQSGWQWSIEALHETLFYTPATIGDRTRYAHQMATVLGSLSLEARRGVENCLLFVMWQALGGSSNNTFRSTEETPATLLASIHGD